jgi:hypothetical protein
VERAYGSASSCYAVVVPEFLMPVVCKSAFCNTDRQVWIDVRRSRRVGSVVKGGY